MNIVEKAVTRVAGQGAESVGMVKIVDPNFQNWLYITYHTVGELEQGQHHSRRDERLQVAGQPHEFRTAPVQGE